MRRVSGQGSMEYLLLIGGAIVVAVVVVGTILGISSTGSAPVAGSVVTDQCNKQAFSIRATGADECGQVTLTFSGVEYTCAGTYPQCSIGSPGPPAPPAASCSGARNSCPIFPPSQCSLSGNHSGQCSLSGSCSGTPDCSAYIGSPDCDMAGGWVICEGVPDGIYYCAGEPDCGSLSEAQCTAYSGTYDATESCIWLGGSCDIYQSCNGHFGDQPSCDAFPGCFWGSNAVSCEPTASACAGGSPPSCGDVPGCSANQSCTGGFVSCTGLAQQACNDAAAAGCAWG